MTAGSRPAHLGDLDEILAIAQVLRRQTEAERGGVLFWRDQDAMGNVGGRIARAIVDPQELCLVGTFDDVVFGFVLGHLDGDQGIISLMGVDDPAREVGIGESMIGTAAHWFQQRRCTGMQSTALPGARQTKNFFESFGMKARLLQVHRTIEPATVSDTGGQVPIVHDEIAAPPPHRPPVEPSPRAETPEAPQMETPETPMVGVGAVIVDADRLLLVQRGKAPLRGRWAVPGGHVQVSEPLATAVEREVQEETGLLVRCGQFLGYVEAIDPNYHYLILDFQAHLVEADRHLRPADDAADAQWVPLDEVLNMDLVDGLGEFLVRHQIVR